MQTVNIHHAKTHLSHLIEIAAAGDPFVIAKAGKPMVKVSALTAPRNARKNRLGFMEGQMEIPEDFDRMGEVEIEGLFAGER